MENYKLNAFNRFFLDRNINYRFASSIPDPYKFLIINKTPIYARLANTPQLTEKGLMGVSELGHNEGCLLVFASESPATLWMKNCKMNLQAATIDNTGKIVDILDMYYADPYRVHYSSKPIRYVLEMKEGFFSKNRIKAGDIVKI